MSIEASASFNLSVKKVEFFPYEWAQNFLAVCMPNEVKVFSFNSYQVVFKHICADFETKTQPVRLFQSMKKTLSLTSTKATCSC